MSLVALVNTTNHLFVHREPLISTPRTNCVNMSLVALVNTANHLLVRREPLISTQEQLWTCPWSCWWRQQTTYLYAENHLFQHSTVGNTTITVVLRPEKRRRICGQMERESCCFVCSFSFTGCGVNESNERMRSVFPSQIVLHFQMGNDKSNPFQKDKHELRN